MIPVRRSVRIVLAAVAVCSGVLGGQVLSAHPGSTTAVVIRIVDQTAVEIALHTNADALATKLEATSASSGSCAALQCSEALLGALRLVVDGARVPLSIVGIEIDTAGQAIVSTRATLPGGARAFTWATSVVYGAYPVAITNRSGQETVRWIQGRNATDPIAIDQGLATGWRETMRLVALGFTHIVPYGLDHILFVAGLALFGTRVRSLLLQVTAFTIAHSVTLALSLLDLVSLPAGVVEPLIAASVAYVGIENLLARQLTRWRVAVVFAFGLLHGLGLAEVLAGMTLSPAETVRALVSFNVGVELGQLAVIGVVWILMVRVVPAHRVAVARLGSVAIGALGLLWTIERITA